MTTPGLDPPELAQRPRVGRREDRRLPARSRPPSSPDDRRFTSRAHRGLNRLARGEPPAALSLDQFEAVSEVLRAAVVFVCYWPVERALPARFQYRGGRFEFTLSNLGRVFVCKRGKPAAASGFGATW